MTDDQPFYAPDNAQSDSRPVKLALLGRSRLWRHIRSERFS
jgi:hypothetical protein